MNLGVRARGGKPAVAAALLTAGLLSVVQAKVERPMLLAERFLSGAGWAEVALLALYAGWVTHHVLDVRRSALWRRRIWGLFSIVFFLQLVIGLAGLEDFLMTGALHIPVPAMIVAGPVYRGAGFFMPILFTVTVLLVGPAWCSYLCYIGAWDSGFAHLRKRPTALPRWRRPLRAAILALVVVSALALRWAGVSGTVAAACGIAFGLAGVAIMATWSRRSGSMVHCLSYCPVGWVATVLGKLSPFRVRIASACNECGACTHFCRYDALSMEDIRRRRPGGACTLCGDCLRACHDRFLEYRLLSLRGDAARAVFLVVVVSLHATFLGVARL
jgi:polyferredoxin